jgi:hypothetical protein
MKAPKTESKLSKIEMACLTACVPCSGDPQIDAIIRVSLRLKLATEFEKALITNYGSRGANPIEALRHADELMAQFDGKPVTESPGGGNN